MAKTLELTVISGSSSNSFAYFTIADGSNYYSRNMIPTTDVAIISTGNSLTIYGSGVQVYQFTDSNVNEETGHTTINNLTDYLISLL